MLEHIGINLIRMARMDDQTFKIVLWGAGIIVACAWAVIQLAICALCRIVWTKVAKNSDRLDAMRTEHTEALNSLRLYVKDHHPTKLEFDSFEVRMNSMVDQMKSDLSRQMELGFDGVKERQGNFRDDIKTLFETKAEKPA